jgi:hypothetical protein
VFGVKNGLQNEFMSKKQSSLIFSQFAIKNNNIALTKYAKPNSSSPFFLIDDFLFVFF